MSVLIKGMDMPKECGVIVIHKEGNSFYATKAGEGRRYPLIHVSPHKQKRSRRMTDYIDRQAAIDAINRAVTKEAARWSVEELPSVEVEPVKRGRWIVEHGVIYGHGENFHYGDLWHCSECGRRELDVEGWDYCPTCGAKMEGAEE